MVKALLVLVRALRSAALVETVGAALITAAAYLWAGLAAALAVAGAALLLKAFEIDGSRGDG